MNSNSNGEVFGSKVLNFAIIATSALILMGVLYQPATTPIAAAGKAQAAHVEQVVVTAHRIARVSG
ncbi:MAG TPA: hypothetical protein VIJ85_03585 [Rhizomicrobium sp.]